MGPFASKYRKRHGFEAFTFFFLSAISFGISALSFLAGPG